MQKNCYTLKLNQLFKLIKLIKGQKNGKNKKICIIGNLSRNILIQEVDEGILRIFFYAKSNQTEIPLN